MGSRLFSFSLSCRNAGSISPSLQLGFMGWPESTSQKATKIAQWALLALTGLFAVSIRTLSDAVYSPAR